MCFLYYENIVMSVTNNKTIEGKADVNQLSVDGIAQDLMQIEHGMELDKELQSIEDDAEVQKNLEEKNFFNKAFTLKDTLDKNLDEVAESDYEAFEFCVARFIVLPCLIKTMMQYRSNTTWIIDIAQYTQSLSWIDMSSPAWLQLFFSAMGVKKSRNTTKLFSMLWTQQPFMNQWVKKRLNTQIITPLKDASIVYAQQYNVLKRKKDKPSTEWIWQFWSNLKQEWLSPEWMNSARKKSDDKTKSVLRWLGAFWLIAGAYQLFVDKPRRKGAKAKIWWLIGDLTKGWALWSLWWMLTRYIMSQFETVEIPFEESIGVAQTEIMNVISEWDIKRFMWTITYEEQFSAIKSYKKYLTPVNKENKTIPGLKIQFKNHVSMIHAANLINYVKYEYKWQWANDKPFYPGDNTWDIYINRMDWEKEVISWWRWSTLSDTCPEINSSHDSRRIFTNYLNSLQEPWWKAGDDSNRYENPQNEVEESINEIKDLIESIFPSIEHWKARDLKCEQINPPYWKQFKIISRGDQETIITIHDTGQFNTIQSITIDWLDFPISCDNDVSWTIHTHHSTLSMFKEAVMLANLTNKAVKENKEKCLSNDPFTYWNTIAYKGIHVNNAPIWFSKHTRYLKDDTIQKYYPTLYKSLQKWDDQGFIKYLNDKGIWM